MDALWVQKRVKRWVWLIYFLLLCLSASCNLQPNMEDPIQTPSEALPVETAPRETARIITPRPSVPRTAASTRTPTQTSTATITKTPTITPTPVYLILRGKVLVRANCRYGPGAPYLYKYGLVPGSNLEVIGRNDLGTWILVQAIGGDNPCWVKASLMEVQGDVIDVAPAYIPLPQSPYYPPLTGVFATREGASVTISWNGVTLRAGDETAEAPYLVEAWVCTDGQLTFTPIGVYMNSVQVMDEPGCSEPSHGRVYLVEKHGYTRWVEIPWPPPA